MRKRKNKAQTFAEYAVLIALIAAALIAMRVFLLRAVQGKFRESADVFGQGEQYRKGTVIVSTSTAGSIPFILPEGVDPCALVIRQVADLEKEINGFDEIDPDDPTGVKKIRHKGLLEQRDGFNTQAGKIEIQIADLNAAGLTEQVPGLIETAQGLRKQATEADEKAKKKQQQINDIKGRDIDRDPKCFS